jgi:hypothetical protein
MGTEILGPQDQRVQEYGRTGVAYRVCANGDLTPVGGGAQTINLEPGTTVMLVLPQSGAPSGYVYGAGGGGQGSQPVIVTTPPSQSPSVLVINTEAKKPEKQSAKATREPFKNL